jgi:hypothetical protein
MYVQKLASFESSKKEIEDLKNILAKVIFATMMETLKQ